MPGPRTPASVTTRSRSGNARGRTTRAKSRSVGRRERSAIPEFIAPQLATLAASPPSGDDWIYEIKFDGYRLLARCDHGDVRLYTRNRQDWTERFPGIVEALAALHLDAAWIDGEAVVVNERGRSDFARLQRSLGLKEAVRFAAFDLLFVDGEDLREQPLAERRARLAQLLGRSPEPPLAYSGDLAGDGASLLREACSLGLEGLIAKRRDAPYKSDRSGAWLKLKCRPRDEFVIGGFSAPRGARLGLGALLLGTFDDGEFRYRGRVGTGLDARNLEVLRAKLEAIATDRCPFAVPPPRHFSGTSVQWVKPRLVAEVEYAEITADGLIRQGSFVGLRDDKDATTISAPPLPLASDARS